MSNTILEAVQRFLSKANYPKSAVDHHRALWDDPYFGLDYTIEINSYRIHPRAAHRLSCGLPYRSGRRVRDVLDFHGGHYRVSFG
jgi:hypothetical protein